MGCGGSEQVVGEYNYAIAEYAVYRIGITRYANGELTVTASRLGDTVTLFDQVTGLAARNGKIGAGVYYSASQFDNVTVNG